MLFVLNLEADSLFLFFPRIWILIELLYRPKLHFFYCLHVCYYVSRARAVQLSETCGSMKQQKCKRLLEFGESYKNC